MLEKGKRSFSRARMGWAALCVTILVLFIVSSSSVAQGHANEVDVQTMPSGEVLPPHVTLDAQDWRLASGLDETVRFAPLASAAAGKWADDFNLPGTDGVVRALAVDNAGKLYVGGEFTTAGGATANNIAVWNGTNWSALGTGVDEPVFSLVVDSAGELYAGGDFTTAGGMSANRIAKWMDPIGRRWGVVWMAGPIRWLSATTMTCLWVADSLKRNGCLLTTSSSGTGPAGPL